MKKQKADLKKQKMMFGAFAALGLILVIFASLNRGSLFQGNLGQVLPYNNSNHFAAATFGSACKMVMTQPSEFNFHLELVNKNTNQRDVLCRVISYDLKNYGRTSAKITGMTEYSLDIGVSNGNRFIVTFEKDGEKLSQAFHFPIVTN